MNTKLFIAAAALAFSASAPVTMAGATTITWNLYGAGHDGDLGPTATYTSGGFSIAAAGFTTEGTPISLFGKDAGPGEQGLGTTTGEDHEINGDQVVRLDLAGALILTGWTITGGSVSHGEALTVYTSNSQTLDLATSKSIASATSESARSVVPERYLFVTVGGPADADVLVRSLTATAAPGSGGTPMPGSDGTSVPEPATLALFGAGLVGIGATRRQRQL